MQNYKSYLYWCICSRYGVWMFLCRSIATNKMFRTYVCPFFHIINSKVLPSTRSYPPFTFFFALFWLRKWNKIHTLHIISISIPGVTITHTIRTMFCCPKTFFVWNRACIHSKTIQYCSVSIVNWRVVHEILSDQQRLLWSKLISRSIFRTFALCRSLL